MELRPYQEAALNAITQAHRQGVKRPVVSMATGTGKTIVLSELLRRQGGTALVLAHRDELVRQAADKIQHVWPEASVGIVKGPEDQWEAPVVVASVQSLHARRLHRWPRDRFATVVVDECFPAGTLVDGRPIERWRPGEILRTFDPDTHRWVSVPVIMTHHRSTTGLMQITLNTSEILRCTCNHPFYTREGWIEAEFLQPGDSVLSRRGWVNVVEAMPMRMATPVDVFNLDVAFPHTYSVGQAGIVVHNCHHAPAPSYRKILDYLQPDLLLGVSATPFRTDLTSLETVFDKIVYSYGIREAIQDGWLVDIQAVRVQGSADLDAVPTRGGDFVEGQLQSVLNSSERNALIVSAYQTHAPGTKAIVFAAGVQHAHDLAQTFRSVGLAAEAVDGTMPLEARRDVLTRLRSGTTRIVTNAAVLCLDEETEILTSEGFVGIDAMTPAHRVANWANGQITFEPPLDIVRRPRAWWERMVVLETPHRSIRVTEGHRLLYRTSREGQFKKAPARDLVGRALQLPISGIADPLDIQPEQPPDLSPQQYQRMISANAYTLRKREGYGFKESIKEATRRFNVRYGLRYKAPSELTLAECRFIGYWLGDGSANRLLSGGIEYKIVENVHNAWIIAWIEGVIAQLDVDFRRRYQERASGDNLVAHWSWSFPRGTGFGSQKRRGLFPLEPYLNKKGSPLLWGLSQEQFAALIEGLWLADGNHGDGRLRPQTYVITKTHRALLELLQAIAVCRGYRASLKPVRSIPPGWSPQYSLSIEREDVHRISNRKSKYTLQFETDWKSERVWCVRTTSGNIITRRHGTVTVMGNSEGFDEPTVETIILARPTKSLALFTQTVGRGTRPAPGKDQMILIDVADNTRRHKIISVRDLLGLRRDLVSGTRVSTALAREARLSTDDEQWLMQLVPLDRLHSEHVPDLFTDLVEDAAPSVDWRDLADALAEIADDPDSQQEIVARCVQFGMINPDGPSTPLQQQRLQEFGWPASEAQSLPKWAASWVLDRHREALQAWTVGRATRWADLLGTPPRAAQQALADALWKLAPATPKQKAWLRQHGTPEALIEGLTKGEASWLIDRLPRQAARKVRHG